MSDVMVYDLIKQYENELSTQKKKAKKLEKAHLGSKDKQELLDLKNQWNEVILSTERLKVEYEVTLREMKDMQQIAEKVKYGETWKYKLARWLVK